MKGKAVSRQFCGSLAFAIFVLTVCSLPAWSQNIVSCSSDDMHYHTCMIGPNRGVRVVRQHSDARCIEGQTYGIRGEQLWVDRGCRADFEVFSGRGGYGAPERFDAAPSAGVITCSSDDMRRHYCGIPRDSRVRLARQRSDAQCIEGRTWGVAGGQVWVDRGCRADFEVVTGRGGSDRDYYRDSGPVGGGVRTITCSSDDMRRHTCDVGPNGGIRMVRQRSDARCELGRTYGFTRDRIWVDRGCRADFEVVTGGR